jgi:hypothetical protein
MSTTLQQALPEITIIDQKQLGNLGSITKITQGAYVRINPGLPWQKQHSIRRSLFSPAQWI